MRGAVLHSGPTAALIEVESLDHVLAFEEAVSERRDAWPGVLDVIPAAKTVLVKVATPADFRVVSVELKKLLQTLPDEVEDAFSDNPRVVEIPVYYDGPDVDEVAELTGLTPKEVIAAHTGKPWRVAFGGFAPGFAYLVGGDPRLEVPRRLQPRTVVPAGAVGLAGIFSGVYPRQSPGGWQIIGHTEMQLWDVTREPPAILRPGWRVQFVEVTA